MYSLASEFHVVRLGFFPSISIFERGFKRLLGKNEFKTITFTCMRALSFKEGF